MSESEGMEEQAIYRGRADLYDPLYHKKKDYEGEAESLRELLLREGVADGARLVDAACGTGSHLAVFARWYEVAGFDGSADMLRIAQAKLPGVDLRVGDLTDFELDPPAQVLTCLFSAIGYVFPEERLRQSARCFARSLAPGGIAVVEPWVTPSKFREGSVGLEVAGDEIPKLARMSTTLRQGNMTTANMEWMVGYPDRIEYFKEQHDLWMATEEELLGAFRDAGLESRWDSPGPMGRGLVVAKKPA